MSVVVVGANHRTAPLDLLERMVISGDRLPKLLHSLDGEPDVSEVVVLATCNRTEVYLIAEKFHGAYCQVRDFFSDLTFLPPDQFAENLYVHYDDVAVRHLFEVSAGLDSAVPGEHEILGQVRRAWEIARDEGTSRRTMNLLFRHAVGVGKRARNETRISHHITSVSQAAVIMAGDHLADTKLSLGVSDQVTPKCAGNVAAAGLTGRRVLVVGAGSMAKGMASFLAAADVAELVIANRSIERAELLVGVIADQTDVSLVRAAPLEDLGAELARVDAVFTATGSEDPLITVEDIPAVFGERTSDLLVVDVGMPRDVDPAVGELDGVTIFDMETVSKLTEANLAARRAETAAVGDIVTQEIDRFTAMIDGREVSPVLTSLRQQAEAVRQSELDRFASKLDGLDESQREMVEALTKAMFAKLLHQPTVRLKDAAGSGRGDRLVESVLDLFDLD